MGFKNISQNRKIRARSVEGEGDVDCVFLFVYGGVVHHEISQYQQTVPSRSDETPARVSERKKAKFEKGKKGMLHHKNAPTFIHHELLATFS